MIKINLPIESVFRFVEKHTVFLIFITLSALSIINFVHYYQTGLGLSYNDARSHLDIGRRVVEGLKPGLAQLGSVWLPLPHLLMVPTIWNDFFWHSGLSGAIQSMIAYVTTGIVIYKILEKIGANQLARIVAVVIWATNINILYLQSTAMTELLLMVTMTTAVYYLLSWFKEQQTLNLIKGSFWVMLASLVRYDGWFLFVFSVLLIALFTLIRRGYKVAEGVVLLFVTLAIVGIGLWFLWNLLIFKDPFYFAFGPFSARAQQAQMEAAGVLMTKGNLLLSLKVYLYAFFFNSYAFIAVLAIFGFLIFIFDKKIRYAIKFGALGLIVPFIFNIIALFFGHSVLFVQGISGDTWFNVRYGVLLMPAVAVFSGYLVQKLANIRLVLIGLLAFVIFFSITSNDSVSIDDATVGSSQKNVTEVSGWLNRFAKDEKGFILISAASHDAIIFSSGLPMSRFIHEGTGSYWESATLLPDRWARWIIMRTYDDNDLTWHFVSKSIGFDHYDKVGSYPFADIYQLKDEYLSNLNTTPILGRQK